MRRLAILLVISFAIAAPAAAQSGRIAAAPPPADPAPLRGPVGMSPTPDAPADAPIPPPPSVQPTGLTASVADGSQCRMTCSRAYYFCLAGEDERCPQYWSRCVSGCRS
jgi:hypothetical protein